MTYYAQIEAGRVVSVTQTSGPIDSPNMVSIAELDRTLLGATYANGTFTRVTAPAWADAGLDQQYHWIDTGPWRDRFGIDWLAITASDNALCKAAAQLWIDRKYINLKDPRNAQVLDALIATSQPATNVLFAGSGPMTVDKKNAILNPVTTEYERHVKGLAQPT